MDKLKLFFANWKTSVPAGLGFACNILTDVAQVIPAEYVTYAHAFCGFCYTTGLIAAKDADKTHSKVIVQPQPEPVTVPVEGEDKSKVVQGA